MPKPHLITFNGESLSRQQWSDRLGIPLGTIAWRHRAGMSPELMLLKSRLPCRTESSRQAMRGRPPVPYERRLATRRTLTFNGETQSIAHWAIYLNLSEETIMRRLRRGRPMEQVLCPKRIPEGRNPAQLKKIRVPLADRTMLTLMSDSMSIREWSEELDINLKLIANRYRRGLTAEECLSKKLLRRGRKRVQKRFAKGGSKVSADAMRKAA